MKMGSYLSSREDHAKWTDYIIRKPSDVKKQENKKIKQKTKPQPSSDSDSSSSEVAEFFKYSSELP